MVKIKNLGLLAFLFTILLSINACYKDSIDFDPYEIDGPIVDPKGDITDFFSGVPDYTKSVNILADEKNYILSEKNTLIEINADIFQLSDGTGVSDSIRFEYIEVLDYPKYAFYQLPTRSGEKLLRTDGVFKFQAYQGEKQLKLKPGKSIRVRVPNDNPEEGMELFYGKGEGEDFTWTPVSNATGTDSPIRISEWGVQIDSLQNWVSGYGYEFNCEIFTWINVDIFADVPEDKKTKVCVELPEIYTNKNTVVFMVFNDIKSILALHSDPDNMKFCEPYGATPIDSDVTFIAIASIDENVFHFALQSATIVENHMEFLDPEPKSLKDIISIIEDL